MNSFIKDYLNSPADAVASVQKRSQELLWTSVIDDEMVYDVLASGHFRLYEAMIFSVSADDLPTRDSIRPVA